LEKREREREREGVVMRERERERARERGRWRAKAYVCRAGVREERRREDEKRDGEREMARTICRAQTFAWRVGEEGGVGFHERAQGLETRESGKVSEVRERETASERKKESVCICVQGRS